jgi:hypothetical protein
MRPDPDDVPRKEPADMTTWNKIVALLVIGVLGVVGCSSNDDPPPNNNVSLTGSVTDQNGAPVPDAKVAVQLGGGEYATTTNASGGYSVEFPLTDLPTYFSGYAYKIGYVPKAIPLIFSSGTVFTVNSSNNVETQTTTGNQVVFEKGVNLIHLGDDTIDGLAATQFQIVPIGDTWTDTFTLTSQQKSSFSTLTITLEARGVECSSAVIRLVETATQTGPPQQKLDATPLNKSFATLTNSFSLQSIPAGSVTLIIQSNTITSQTTPTISGGTCPVGGKDDFEFIQVVGTLS